MGKQTSNFGFTGSIGNVSAYTVGESQQVYIRSKGGPSKNRIKNDPAFELVRKNNSEFSVCTQLTRSVKRAMFPIRKFGDYNYSPIINGIMRFMIQRDTNYELGKRGALFSSHGAILEGFDLNKYHLFTSVIRPSILYKIDYNNGSATVELPALLKDVHFFPDWPQPLFRMVATLGVLNDWHHDGRQYTQVAPLPNIPCAYAPTNWHSAAQPYAGETLTLQLGELWQPAPSRSLMLSIGLEMATPVTNQLIKPTHKKSCAKILKVERPPIV